MLTRISEKEARKYVSTKDDYSGGFENATYFTLTPMEDGWDEVKYYTSRKRNIYHDRSEGRQWVYILSNPATPGLYKIGYTTQDPEERAKQISSSTGVIMPYKVEWAFKCFDGELLEKEIHHKLKEYRVNNQREFFQVDLEDAKNTIKLLGENYI